MYHVKIHNFLTYFLKEHKNTNITWHKRMRENLATTNRSVLDCQCRPWGGKVKIQAAR